MRLALMVAALSLVAMASQPARAQEPVGQINGTVFDKDKKGIPGLPVAAILQPGAHLYGTSTDEGGRYAFKGLEAGSYTIVVSHDPEGVSRKDGVRVRPLFRSIVDFNLLPGPPDGSLPPLEPAPGAGSPAMSISCTLFGPERAPAADAWVALTPLGEEGQSRRARSSPEGECLLADVPLGTYRLSAKAPGFITWSLGPVTLKGTGSLKLALSLIPFPMGFEGTLEDLLIPADPIPPSKP